MMKFYADENFPLRTIHELRSLGHDVLTAFEDERANLSVDDDQVLSRAAELGRAVLTLNRKDFKRLHYNNPNQAGIINCTEDADRAGQAKRINEKVSELKTLEGELINIYRPS